MSAEALAKALATIHWDENVKNFLSEVELSQKIATANTRLAIWARQFEMADKGNPALCFVREMQVAGHHVALVTALALYKIAAASMRAAWDNALYYSYFRTHRVELATLVRDPGFYMEKREILDFHRQHTINFLPAQNHVGLLTRLEPWYGLVSSIVHGQLPGVWSAHTSLSEIRYNKKIAENLVVNFVEGVEIVHRLFLCTVGRTLWTDFTTTAKRQLLAGLPGDVRTTLRLDRA